LLQTFYIIDEASKNFFPLDTKEAVLLISFTTHLYKNKEKSHSKEFSIALSFIISVLETKVHETDADHGQFLTTRVPFSHSEK
jgi:hypothetical protein